MPRLWGFSPTSGRAGTAAVLRPAALSAEGAIGVAQTEIPDADPGGWEACADVSGGNPFLLRALLNELRQHDPDLGGPIAAALAERAPDSVVAWVTSQLAALPPAASALASAVAALGRPTARAADAVAAIGLLRPGTPLVFTNVMVERAVLQSIPQLERDALQHRADAD